MGFSCYVTSIWKPIQNKLIWLLFAKEIEPIIVFKTDNQISSYRLTSLMGTKIWTDAAGFLISSFYKFVNKFYLAWSWDAIGEVLLCFPYRTGNCDESAFQRTCNHKLPVRKGTTQSEISWRTRPASLCFRRRTVHCLQTLWSYLPGSGRFMLKLVWVGGSTAD